jgi:hypothetical protein
MNYHAYYSQQAGSGSTDYFSAPFWQRGYGMNRQRGGNLRSFFSRMWATVKPFLTKTLSLAKPLVRSAGESLKQSALTGVSNMARDVADGRRLPDAFSTGITKAIDVLRNDTREGLENVAARMRDNGAALPEQSLIRSGAGYKKRRTKRKKFIVIKPRKNKTRESDIFGEF